MARARNIKPAFFDNEILSELEPLARLLFIGLWCIADRAGRLEDRPKRIKKEILGYDECDCDYLLNALASAGFIQRYEVDGGQYIQIHTFSKHQKPHQNEAASIIPAPDLLPRCEALATKERSARADSLNPLTDSLNPHPSPPTPIAEAPGGAGGGDGDTVRVFRAWDRATARVMVPLEAEQITALIDEYGADNVINAIGVAVSNNAAKVSYIQAVLRNKASPDTKKGNASLPDEDTIARWNREWEEQQRKEVQRE